MTSTELTNCQWSPRANLLNRASLPLRAAGLALLYLAAALAGIELTREAGNVAAIWPPNAILLAVLLRSQIGRWPVYLLFCALANLAANLIVGDTLLVSAGFALVNMAEVMTGCALVRYVSNRAIRLGNVRELTSFAIFAGLLAPMVGATFGAALVSLAFDAPYWSVWKVWWIADAMGILIVAPPLLCWDAKPPREWVFSGEVVESLLILLGVTATTLALFSQDAAPWLFLIPPILLWAAIRMGLLVTAVAGLFVSTIAVALTINLDGPIAAIPAITISERVLYLQLFLGTSVVAPLIVAVAMGELRSTGAALAQRGQTLALSNAELEAVVEQRELLLKELQHRIKNNLQVVVSLLNLRSDDVQDPRAKNALLEASSRVEAIALVHRYFYQSDRPGQVSVSEYLPELVSMIAKVNATDTDHISVRAEIEDIALSLDQTTPVTLILNELLSNAFKHAFPDGRAGSINVTVRCEQGQDDPRIGYIAVRDDGVGIPDDFDLPRATSTGLKVFLGLLRQIDGQVDLERDGGTAFHIRFPLVSDPVPG